jgi:hypothetical protein
MKIARVSEARSADRRTALIIRPFFEPLPGDNAHRRNYGSLTRRTEILPIYWLNFASWPFGHGMNRSIMIE